MCRLAYEKRRTLNVRRYLLLPMGTLCLVLFVELGIISRSGPLPIDTTVALWFKEHRTAREVNLAKVISAVTAPIIVFIVIITILLFLNYRTRSWYVRDFIPLAIVGTAALISLVSNWYFNRSRPGSGLAAYFDFTTSYPSGHAVFMAATGWALLFFAQRRKAHIFVAVSCLTVFIGIVQLILGIHWITDVIGSTFLSWGLLIIFYVLDDWLAEREISRL
jgi:membrane-associated phospholipid phosphatase